MDFPTPTPIFSGESSVTPMPIDFGGGLHTLMVQGYNIANNDGFIDNILVIVIIVAVVMSIFALIRALKEV
jgi:hypothetical protein